MIIIINSKDVPNSKTSWYLIYGYIIVELFFVYVFSLTSF